MSCSVSGGEKSSQAFQVSQDRLFCRIDSIVQLSLLSLHVMPLDWLEKDKVHLGEELSDVLIYLIRLSERCHVNLPAAVMRKFKMNAQKYPTSVKDADSEDKTADPVATNTESSLDSESVAIDRALLLTHPLTGVMCVA